MSKQRFVYLVLAALLGLFLSCRQENVADVSHVFVTDSVRIGVNERGCIAEFADTTSGSNYVPADRVAPLLSIVDDGKLKKPLSFIPEGETGFRLSFEDSAVGILLQIAEKQTHISLTVQSVSNADTLEAIIWGPYPNTIGDTIGENIGVVRNGDFALGIQSLNPRTTAGKLENVQGIVGYHGSAAEAAEFGSVLQAFAINRTRDLSQSEWEGWENKYPGRPVQLLNEAEGAVTGSAIALFGCQPGNVVATIGKIEVAEGLPHPEINGVWVKESRETGRAYAISPFTEGNVDQMIAYAQKAGLRSLYHEKPFETWGHFTLNKEMFPNGRDGLKACVQKARAAGLNMGVHTLTNFITPDDPFVTPIPDERLVSLGSTTLVTDISESDTDIEIADIAPLTIQKNSKLHTVRIGTELIQYGSFSEETPFTLYGCQRGAFETNAQSHAQGQSVVNLLDFAYRTFYPNWDMQKEMCANIGDLLNETGVTQMGFDGHEGCYATGHGDYAMDLFALDWHNQLEHVVINSSSRLKHFYWHINHFINWGEPWYGGFRESQTDRRFKVQPFLERNYLRNMLGWFMIQSTTIPTDIEWMMARAAGYDAGFALVLRLPELDKNPYTDELLDLIKTWEHARLAGLFTEAQRARLKDNNSEFHLETQGEDGLVLHSYTTNSFEHVKRVLQPGEPTDSEWSFRNDAGQQPLQFRLTVKGDEGHLSALELEFDRSFTFNLPAEVKAGTSLVCDGSAALRLYDKKGRFVSTYDLVRPAPSLRKGNHVLRFDCEFGDSDDLKVNLVVKQKGKEETIRMKTP